MKFTLIVPTIYIPHFLKDYQANAEKYGHEIDYVVVGDLKSPDGTAEFCRTIPNCTYLDPGAQSMYMARFPQLASHIPFNCAERLNIGMLYAYEHGTDLFFMVNDDNFPTDYDMIGGHKTTGKILDLYTIESSSGWYNVCDLLGEESDFRFFHRGYPRKQRWEDGELNTIRQTRKIIVNEGLWLDDPDTDAITRLETPLNTTGYGFPENFVLAKGTWSPLNSQNTTIAREAVPAYFQSPYIGRHSDIWAGYVVVRLAEHFNHAISFGQPLSIHKRSPHDLWKDLDAERLGMQLTDDFCDVLRGIKITANTYYKGFAEIINGLADWGTQSEVTNKVLEGMFLWHQAVNTVIDD